MSKLRVLRCTRQTYSIVASYAGHNELSLCEALSQIVNGTSVNAPEMKNDSSTAQEQTPDPWQFWEDWKNNNNDENPAEMKK